MANDNAARIAAENARREAAQRDARKVAGEKAAREAAAKDRRNGKINQGLNNMGKKR